ncbi:hypothetical protein EJ04DRAFT_301595 [Polyplosphaeria fusca]|uniref:Uncharacterized protein n=1 Tax=Polyplosphaeria fusca TaxID=682080 RepID=A0A9P4QS43_9PLEO|nr:hypothetical protein EJ04DRAFT_301595 [Polyplosphaeria fusca]
MLALPQHRSLKRMSDRNGRRRHSKPYIPQFLRVRHLIHVRHCPLIPAPIRWVFCLQGYFNQFNSQNTEWALKSTYHTRREQQV